MAKDLRQQHVRMARLLVEGTGRDAVCGELGISIETFYRWKRSAPYKAVADSLSGFATVPADHPDVLAAREATARTELSIAEKVERGVSLGLDTIVDMMQRPQDHRLGEVVAATKFLLEQHQIRVGTGADDTEPLTPEEVAAARKMMGAA